MARSCTGRCPACIALRTPVRHTAESEKCHYRNPVDLSIMSFGASSLTWIARVRFEHLEKVVEVVEQPAAQHIGEVIVQHRGVIAKLVRYLARCARGIQRVGDDVGTSGEIHG